MAFDAEPGGDPRGPWCKSCRRPIEDEPATQVNFNIDPESLNGPYHSVCAKPVLGLGRVFNMNWNRF